MITVDQGPVNGVLLVFVSFGITFVLNLAASYWPEGEMRQFISKIVSPALGSRFVSKPLFSRGYLVLVAFFWWIGTFLILFTTNQNNTAYWVFVGLYGGHLIFDKFWYQFYFHRKEQTVGMILLGGAFLLSVGMLVDFLVGQMIFRNTLCEGAPATPFVCGNYGIALAGAIVFFINILLYFVTVRRVMDDWAYGKEPARR